MRNETFTIIFKNKVYKHLLHFTKLTTILMCDLIYAVLLVSSVSQPMCHVT